MRSLFLKVQIKIKMDSGKEITLEGKDAEELYNKLKEIYDRTTWIPYPYNPAPYWPRTLPEPVIWYSTSSNTSVFYQDKI